MLTAVHEAAIAEEDVALFVQGDPLRHIGQVGEGDDRLDAPAPEVLRCERHVGSGPGELQGYLEVRLNALISRADA